MRGPLAITDERLEADPEALDRAWEGDPPFTLLPGRAALGDDDARAAWDLVPEGARAGAFALATSGSTGRPKLVIGSRARALGLARVLHAVQDLEPVSQAIVALPLTYSYAFVNQWVWARAHQRELVVTRGLARPDRWVEILTEARDALLCLVGTQVPLLARAIGDRAFDGVLRVCFAGGRFPAERLDVVRRAFPRATILNNYGCTEAMPRLSVRRAEQASDASHVGYPLPGIELRAGEGGALQFRSPFSAVGWVEGGRYCPIGGDTWVPTGDLGEIAADGGLRLLGRSGDVFKRHGEKVSLFELMQTVQTVFMGDAAIYRETDPSGEPGCVLAVSPAPSPAEIREILLALRRRHPRAQWPLRLESLAAMPRLPSGKIDHAALPAAEGRITHWYQRIGDAA